MRLHLWRPGRFADQCCNTHPNYLEFGSISQWPLTVPLPISPWCLPLSNPSLRISIANSQLHLRSRVAAMPTTQATALSETTLDDLTPSGERIPQLNRCDSHSGFHHIAPSIADSYIPEIHFARTQRLTKVGPEADPPLRPTLRQFVSAISSHKITRRTFYFMILFGFTTIFYNSMNLIPAFRGTKFASEELIIQRINGFIQECLSRNVCLRIMDLLN